MWETEHFLNTKYPDFLPSQTRKWALSAYLVIFESRDEIPIKGVGYNTLCFCLVVISANDSSNHFSNYLWEP
jgi:hypothetical protein